MTDVDVDQLVIEQFRANEGRVGGPLEGVPVLLLHHRGRTTGATYVTPLVYQPHGSSWVVFASNYGSPVDPEWYRNLVAAPEATVEVGTVSVPVVARRAVGDERAMLWRRQKERLPHFAEYERLTSREIPVVVLETPPRRG